MALLEISGLTVQRGTRTVLDNLDLTIESGECVILVGENGAGKSTLIEAAAGILPLHSGSIAIQRPFGLTLQTDGIHGDELVHERIGYAANVAGVEKKSAESLLERWNISHRRADRIGHLSGGMRRRLGVIQGLMPAHGEGERICLLDEPSEGLDEASVQTLIGDLTALRERGHAFLIATHDARLHDCATSILTLDGKKVEKEPSTEAGDVPVLDPAEPTDSITRWSSDLDFRTKWTLLTRLVPWLVATLTLVALTDGIDLDGLDPSLRAAIFLLPTFLAAMAPHGGLQFAKENRCGDWWRAQGASLGSINLGVFIALAIAPVVTIAFLSGEAKVIQDPVLLAFPLIMCASTAIQELSSRMPRDNAQVISLLTLVLVWPFLLAVEAMASKDWTTAILAAGIPLVIWVAMPLFHPRTGSN